MLTGHMAGERRLRTTKQKFCVFGGIDRHHVHCGPFIVLTFGLAFHPPPPPPPPPPQSAAAAFSLHGKPQRQTKIDGPPGPLPPRTFVSPFGAVACFFTGAWTIGVFGLWGPTILEGRSGARSKRRDTRLPFQGDPRFGLGWIGLDWVGLGVGGWGLGVGLGPGSGRQTASATK